MKRIVTLSAVEGFGTRIFILATLSDQDSTKDFEENKNIIRLQYIWSLKHRIGIKRTTD